MKLQNTKKNKHDKNDENDKSFTNRSYMNDNQDNLDFNNQCKDFLAGVKESLSPFIINDYKAIKNSKVLKNPTTDAENFKTIVTWSLNHELNPKNKAQTNSNIDDLKAKVEKELNNVYVTYINKFYNELKYCFVTPYKELNKANQEIDDNSKVVKYMGNFDQLLTYDLPLDEVKTITTKGVVDDFYDI